MSLVSIEASRYRILEPQQPLGHAVAMDPLPPPLAFFLLLFSGWVNRQQQAVIEYLREENRGLPAAQQSPRLRPTDDQRRRLAVKGKILGRRRLAAIAGIVTPDTILRGIVGSWPEIRGIGTRPHPFASV